MRRMNPFLPNFLLCEILTILIYIVLSYLYLLVVLALGLSAPPPVRRPLGPPVYALALGAVHPSVKGEGPFPITF